jgi:hypothetical protein
VVFAHFLVLCVFICMVSLGCSVCCRGCFVLWSLFVKNAEGGSVDDLVWNGQWASADL